MEKKEAIKIIVQCAKTYKQCLLNQNIMFVYYERKYNRYAYFETTFLSSNFCHLTGVEREKSISPNDFFNRCIQHKLSPDNFELRDDGTTEMKLQVLPYIIQIHRVSKMTGDHNKYGIQLHTERLAGNVKGCVGFVKDGGYFVPNTVLRENVRNITLSPQHRIVATFSKKMKEDKYTTLSYTAKGFDIRQLTAVPTIAAKVDFAQFMGNQTDTEEE